MTDTSPTGVLVDANVLLDLFTDDPVWAPWSEAHLAEAFNAGQVMINPIVYAEISKLLFWPGNASSSTAAAAASDDHRCPISTSAPTPPSPAARY